MDLRKILEKHSPRLRANPSCKIFVFGAGFNWMNICYAYMETGSNLEDDIDGFIDNNPDKQGKIFRGKQVYALSDIDTDNAVCIISIADYNSIKGILTQLSGYSMYENEHVFHYSKILTDSYNLAKLLVEFEQKLKQIHIPVYMCVNNKDQGLLHKFLNACGVVVQGYITHENIGTLSDGKTKILLAEEEYGVANPALSDKKIEMISLGNGVIKAIEYKMRAKSANETLVNFHVVDHCNLNCRFCNNFSPIAEPRFLELSSFEHDIAKISELSNQSLRALNLMGGEPLLHKELPAIMRLARKYLPNTKIVIITNGLLLLNQEMEEVWSACRECKIAINVTRYPIKIDFEAIEERAQLESVKIIELDRPALAKTKLDPEGSMFSQAIACFEFNNCAHLRDGKLFLCATSAYIGHFNYKYGKMFHVSENDYLDIHRTNNFNDISQFLSYPTPFCRYCDIAGKKYFNWALSNYTADEYL